MVWTNAPLTVHHGTDEAGANGIVTGGINLTVCRPYADFGRGFYVTSSLHQAQQWANLKALRAPPPLGGSQSRAAVLTFNLDRDAAGDLNDHLAFVLPSREFSDFVDYNRLGSLTHARGGGVPYDLVYGPVAAYPQALIFMNCDQICLLTSVAPGVLSGPTAVPA